MIRGTPTYRANPGAFVLDPEQSRLAAMFTPVYDQAARQVEDARGDAYRRLRSNQAARGILRSGLSEYGSGEIEKGSMLGTGEAAAKLAGLLGQTESSRSLMNTQSRLAEEAALREHQRNLELANLLGRRKKSKLGSFMGGATGGAMAGSAFGPWGAAIGGGAGGLAGLFDE